MGKSMSTAKQIGRTAGVTKFAERSTIRPEHNQETVQNGK